MLLSIGSDHAGFLIKKRLFDFLIGSGYETIDRGCYSDATVDYPDIASLVSEDVIANKARFGILICGSGIGMSIAANKYSGIRAALCLSTVSSRLAREHNNANVLCLGARFLSPEESCEIVSVFLSSDFSDEERHIKRVAKLDSK